MKRMRILLVGTLMCGLLIPASTSRADPLSGWVAKLYCNGNSTLTCGVGFKSDAVKGLVTQVTVDIKQYAGMSSCESNTPEGSPLRIYDQTWPSGISESYWESTSVGCTSGKWYRATLTVTYQTGAPDVFTSSCVECYSGGQHGVPMTTPLGAGVLIVSILTLGAVVIGGNRLRKRKLPTA